MIMKMTGKGFKSASWISRVLSLRTFSYTPRLDHDIYF